MKACFLLMLALLSFGTTLYSQNDFRSGFILTLSGDTLYGKINYKGDVLMGTRCKFKVSDETPEVHYSPYDIKGYRFENGKYYISKEINYERFFLEFLIHGKVNIYYLRDDIGDRYFIEKEEIGFKEIPYKEEIKDIRGTSYLYRPTRHKGVLHVYTQDAPGFQEKINNIGKPKSNNLTKLAENYHNRVCKEEPCIIYTKKLPFINLQFEPSFGWIFINHPELKNLNSSAFGALAHLWLPRVNEKLFLKTGMMFFSSEAIYEREITIREGNVMKIPVQIEYKYPKGKVRPNLAYGINIYPPFFVSHALTTGIDVEVHNKLKWVMNYDIDFIPHYVMPLIPTRTFTQGLSTGIALKLF